MRRFINLIRYLMKKILNLFVLALVCCMMMSCTRSKVNGGIDAAAAGDFAKAKAVVTELYAEKDKLSTDNALGVCAIINIILNTDQSLAQDQEAAINYCNQFLEFYTQAAKDPEAVEKFNVESKVNFTELFEAYSAQMQAVQAAQEAGVDVEEYVEEGDEGEGDEEYEEGEE